MTDPTSPSEPERRPALRASDADRERVVSLLRDAAGDGRLDVDELDERIAAVYRTRTRAELEPYTHDLVDATGATAAPGGPVVRPGDTGERRIISVMSGSDRRGRWRIAARCLVLSLMGGSDLDLCDAEFSDARTEIRMIALMGGNELRLPSGVEVQVSRFAFMGGNDVTLDEERPPTGAPVVHVRLFALMGGNEVKQGRPQPKPSLRERARRLTDGDG